VAQRNALNTALTRLNLDTSGITLATTLRQILKGAASALDLGRLDASIN